MVDEAEIVTIAPETTIPGPQWEAPYIETHGFVVDDGVIVDLVLVGPHNDFVLYEADGPGAAPGTGREVSRGSMPDGEGLSGVRMPIHDLGVRVDAGEDVWVSMAVAGSDATSEVVRLHNYVAPGGRLEVATVGRIEPDRAICFDDWEYVGDDVPAFVSIRGDGTWRSTLIFMTGDMAPGRGVAIPNNRGGFPSPSPMPDGTEVVVTIQQRIDSPTYGNPDFQGPDGLPFATTFTVGD